MSTYKELVYMVLDELKIQSDDATYTEDHIIFLLNKYRTFLLKQRYSDIKKQVPESNYQTICLDLIEVPAMAGECCACDNYLRSANKIPYLMKIGNAMISPIDYYQGNIELISRDRMKYVGHNKYLKNIIYASIGPDRYLYFKSSNPQFLYLEKIRCTGVFENPQEVFELNESTDSTCDILDTNFPMEEALIPPTIELVVKELLGASYRPKDSINNATDDLADLASYIAKNAKSALAKQLSE